MERSLFFNSAPGDERTYQASDFASYFGNVLSTGLLHTDEIPALEVKCDGTDLRTYVEPGKAIMQGYAYENTSNLYLDHALPEATLDRIDRIVLRLDKRNQSRFIKLFVLQGEPADVPIAPVLTRDEFIHEISLAQIRVRANTSTLQPADLIDERLDESLCGLVFSLIGIPTSQFQSAWDNWFNTNTASFEQQYYDWFNDLQATGYASQSEFATLQTAFNEHQADDVRHTTQVEKDDWNNKIDSSEKGMANGVATLGSDGLLIANQLPSVGSDFRTWEKVAEITLTATSTDEVVFNNLAQTPYKHFKIIGEHLRHTYNSTISTGISGNVVTSTGTSSSTIYFSQPEVYYYGENKAAYWEVNLFNAIDAPSYSVFFKSFIVSAGVTNGAVNDSSGRLSNIVDIDQIKFNVGNMNARFYKDCKFTLYGSK
jgi:hypothetical protein